MLVSDNEARGLADPHSTRRAFVALVNSATQSINACFYDLDDAQVADALVKARRRSVRVRLVTDTDNLFDKKDKKRPRYAIQRIKQAGIPIVDDRRGAFMHHKFMVVDNRAVWFGSLNPTFTSFFDHNNNVIIINSTRLASIFNAEFTELFENNRFAGPRQPQGGRSARVGNIGLSVYFSPNGGAREALLNEVATAATSIRFMVFSFSDKRLAEIMLARRKAGVNVEGIFDDCQISKFSMFYPLLDAGVNVYRDGNQALLHHKVIIIDGETVIAGSYNYSMSADIGNNEDLVILRSRAVAAVFNEEFERLKRGAIEHKNIPPYNHPACEHRQPLSIGDKLRGKTDTSTAY